MNLRKLFTRIVLFAVILLLVSCGDTGEFVQGVPVQFEASIGTMTIERVSLSDRYPSGCSPLSRGCNVAPEDQQYLVFQINPTEVAKDPAVIMVTILSEAQDASLVTDNGGQPHFAFIARGNPFFVGFAVPRGASTFTLNWPNNPPLQFGR